MSYSGGALSDAEDWPGRCKGLEIISLLATRRSKKESGEEREIEWVTQYYHPFL